MHVQTNDLPECYSSYVIDSVLVKDDGAMIKIVT